MKNKQRHLNFINEQKLNRATLLLTGMPELEARPLLQVWAEYVGKILGGMRFVMEALLTEIAFVAPWLLNKVRTSSTDTKHAVRRGYAIFPKEFWLSLLLVAGTGLILAW